MVNDGDAAPTDVARAGKTFEFPPEYLAALGSGPSSPGYIPDGTAKVRGYLRTESNGSHSWVMTSEITPTQKTAILAMPGGLGWIDQSMAVGSPLRIAITVARTLVTNTNISGPDLADAMTKLIRAGAANRDQQVASGG